MWLYTAGAVSHNSWRIELRTDNAARPWRVAFFVANGGNDMDDYVPMTRDGYNRIKAEAERMERVDMPAIAEKIAAARAEGDLSENAEYHAQREAQGLLQAKINLLKTKLARAQIIDPATLPRDQVCFGSTVVVKEVDFGDEEEYTLVGAGDEDYDKGRILVTSPLGQGLLGKRIGEKAEIPAPKGSYELEVVAIRFDFLEGA
jgi:transcription elongation factor GreA